MKNDYELKKLNFYFDLLYCGVQQLAHGFMRDSYSDHYFKDKVVFCLSSGKRYNPVLLPRVTGILKDFYFLGDDTELPQEFKSVPADTGNLDILLPKRWTQEKKMNVIIEFMNKNRDKTVVILTPESQLLSVYWRLFTAFKINQAIVISEGDTPHGIIRDKKMTGQSMYGPPEFYRRTVSPLSHAIPGTTIWGCCCNFRSFCVIPWVSI